MNLIEPKQEDCGKALIQAPLPQSEGRKRCEGLKCSGSANDFCER